MEEIGDCEGGSCYKTVDVTKRTQRAAVKCQLSDVFTISFHLCLLWPSFCLCHLSNNLPAFSEFLTYRPVHAFLVLCTINAL